MLLLRRQFDVLGYRCIAGVSRISILRMALDTEATLKPRMRNKISVFLSCICPLFLQISVLYNTNLHICLISVATLYIICIVFHGVLNRAIIKHIQNILTHQGVSLTDLETQHTSHNMAPLAPVITPTLLSTIRKHPNLPRNSWYFITATALSALNRPDELHKVLSHAIENAPDAPEPTNNLDEQLGISRRIREALIKSSAVGGMPRV